jgi:predicted Zn-ribbon and HTH transcriptional regulator
MQWWFYGISILGGVAILTIITLLIVGVTRGIREGETEYRIRTNRCVTCGYQLKLNKSEVCPECGARKSQS